MRSAALDASAVIGSHDVLLLVIDCLRYDVAADCFDQGLTPNLASWLPHGWEPRHSPGNFTFAAHAAFFAGFLPTPARAGPHRRLFAVRFPKSRSIGPGTCVLEAPDLVTGLAARGYHTVCIGGTGFFDPSTPLGAVLPGLFAERHWRPAFSVRERDSTRYQVEQAVQVLERLPPEQRVFLFVNVSAVHAPNHFYLDGGPVRDSLASHRAALQYVDSQLPPLLLALRRRAPLLALFGSDHGEAYGEDGYHGHRLGHAAVWTVPWAEVLLPQLPARGNGGP